MVETKAFSRCAPLSVIVAEMICPHTRSVWLSVGLLSGCSRFFCAPGLFSECFASVAEVTTFSSFAILLYLLARNGPCYEANYTLNKYRLANFCI